MGYRREYEPSPLRTGIVHAGLSLAVFGGLAGSLGLGIHVVADPGAASPSQTLALFDTGDVGAGMATASLVDPGQHPGGSEFPELDTGSAPMELAYTEPWGDGLRI